MRARLRVLDKRGLNARGYLPFTDQLSFSTNLDGDGVIQLEALMSDIDALSAWDCSVVVELSTDGGATWVDGPAYALRHDYTHQGGYRRFAMRGTELLQKWANETLVLPEQVRGNIYKTSGDERYVGWMASAYDPANDPDEPWNLCVDTGRTGRPKGWPTGSGAKWITASNFTSVTESKYYRAWITIPGTSRQRVRFYLSADQESQLYVAGEKVIEGNWDEGDWKNDYARRSMSLYPGTYAVAIHNNSQVSKGGDGIDPTLFAAALLNDQGQISQWLLRSDDAYFRACRRDDVPPNDRPPGPTPGQVIRYMVDEAKDRNCTGWPSVTYGFTATHDSYGQPWSDIAERVYRIGEDYFSVFQGLAEAEDCDLWLSPGMVLHAAKRRGRPLGLVMTSTHFSDFSTRGTSGQGSWVLAKSDAGWFSRQRSGFVRREYNLTLGQATSKYTTERIMDSSLRDGWRWDASGSLNPPQPGWIPWVDLQVGDWLNVSYRQIQHAICIQSISAQHGDGGMRVQMDFSEYPIDGWVGGDPALLAPPIDGGLPNPEVPDTRAWGEH